jgi:hypothetical protein
LFHWQIGINTVVAPTNAHLKSEGFYRVCGIAGTYSKSALIGFKSVFLDAGLFLDQGTLKGRSRIKPFKVTADGSGP